MKILIYDVETTGLDSQKSAIHQLSGKVVIDGEVKETFNFKLCPHGGADITDEALKVSGVTREQIAGYPNYRTVFEQFKMMLEKYVSKYDLWTETAGRGFSAFPASAARNPCRTAVQRPGQQQKSGRIPA